MPSEEIRRRFLEFLRARGHTIIPSSSLIPDDPSVLLTTAGMQQFKPYFLGKADPVRDFGSKNTASIQKCFRTSDIDMVGDESHLTFFEMLGNFSFGGYFKKEAIEYGHEFIVKELGLKIDYVTVFGGDPSTSSGQVLAEDRESAEIWRSLGIEDIRKGSREDNFWGPTGSEGPCGPTTEIYVKGIEVWNIVFNEYYCSQDKRLEKMETPGVDTGMGLERLATVVQEKPTIFETDLFNFIMREFPDKLPLRVKRIIADHIRAITFLISDGVMPSNKGAGYVLRRFLRRIITFVYKENIGADPVHLLRPVVDKYKKFPDYRNLDFVMVEKVFREEYGTFMKTLGNGLKKLERFNTVDAKSAFRLYESFGLPYEVIKDYENGSKAKGLRREDFDAEFARHQETSRAGAEKKFGGHGLILNTGELKAGDEAELKKVTRLHTATHLLQWALREVLGKEVKQAGSDITPERTRFDFTFSRKLTPEEVKKVEDLVNQKIKENLPVSFKEMPKNEAEKTGALYFFKEKYPEKVRVYYIGKSLEAAISKEFCGGPHVRQSGEIGKFKISKEESVAAGVRRIRGVIE